MKTRQEGIEKNIIGAGEEVSKMMTPGLPPFPKAKAIAKIQAKATAKTYDSTKDPIVLAINPLGLITINHGSSYTFVHNMGYIPIVQIVSPNTSSVGLWVQDLTDIICTIYCYNTNSVSNQVKIYCH